MTSDSWAKRYWTVVAGVFRRDYGSLRLGRPPKRASALARADHDIGRIRPRPAEGGVIASGVCRSESSHCLQLLDLTENESLVDDIAVAGDCSIGELQ